MAKGVLFFGWGNATRGREMKALQVFQEALGYWGGLQQKGEVDSFEPYFLEPHGGDLVGFLIVKGDQDKLNRLRTAPDTLRLNARAGLIVENFGMVGGFTGKEMEEQIGVFQSSISELS
jgi:hypothetical protein